MDGPWLSVWFMFLSNVNTDPFQLLIRLKQGTLAQFANLGEICVTFREWRRRAFVKEHCQVLAFDKNLRLTRLKFLINQSGHMKAFEGNDDSFAQESWQKSGWLKCQGNGSLKSSLWHVGRRIKFFMTPKIWVDFRYQVCYRATVLDIL